VGSCEIGGDGVGVSKIDDPGPTIEGRGRSGFCPGKVSFGIEIPSLAQAVNSTTRCGVFSLRRMREKCGSRRRPRALTIKCLLRRREICTIYGSSNTLEAIEIFLYKSSITACRRSACLHQQDVNWNVRGFVMCRTYSSPKDSIDWVADSVTLGWHSWTGLAYNQVFKRLKQGPRLRQPCVLVG